ncbi:MAG TPA: TonB-dependent receptor [Nevskiaceae bacterium]|nr:TonB-dependent receptor [Nevskiaceae bacterium]
MRTVVLYAGACLPATGHAQEAIESIPVEAPAEAAATAPPGSTSSSRIAVGEIVVTAQKRAENIQDVPISIQAFSGEELDARGITDAQKLQTITSGLVYDQFAGYSIVYLRGVGTDAFAASADLSVAMYVDGVYFPFSINLAQSFGEVERVEVLKGPQGTLFGRNATGGAINVITRQPDDTWTATAGASYGRFDNMRTRAYLSGPLMDGLSFGLGMLYNRREDWYDYSDASPNRDVDLQQTQDKGANLKLRWEAGDAFDAIVSGYWFESVGVGTYMWNLDHPSATLGNALMLEPEPEDYKTSTNTVPRGTFRFKTASLTLNARPDAFDLKSITSYQNFTGQGRSDFDGTEADVAEASTVPTDAGGLAGSDLQRGRAASQEFQLLSKPEGFGPDWLTYTAGLYWFKSFATTDPALFNSAGLEDLLSGDILDAAGNPLLTPLGDLLNSLDLPVVGTSIGIFSKLDTEAYAGYAQFGISPVEWATLTLGGRYGKEKRDVFDARSSLILNTGEQVNLRTFDDDGSKDNNFSPRVALQLTPFDADVNLYGSWSKGYKSGSFNLVNLLTPPSPFIAEEVTSIEAGVKATLFGRLRANAAVFRNRIDDLQVQFTSLFSGGVTTFENAGRATIKGAEAELVWGVTDDLVLSLSGTWLDGQYDEYANASGFDEQTGLYSRDNDYTGNDIVRTPHFTGTLGLNYAFAVPGGTVELGTTVYHNSGFWYDASNTLRQRAYDTLGAQAGYLWASTNLRITVFGDNLTDEKYYAYRFGTDFGSLFRLAEPRTYGVRVAWEF